MVKLPLKLSMEGERQLHISSLNFPAVSNSLRSSSKKSREVLTFFFSLKPLHLEICFAAELKTFIVTLLKWVWDI